MPHWRRLQRETARMPHDQASNSWRDRHDAPEMALEITDLLMAFRDRPADPTKIVEVYCSDLGDLELALIRRVCWRFRRGQVRDHDGAFAPSLAQLWCEIDRIHDEDREHRRLTGTGEFAQIAGPVPPPMPKIERGYHPSWELLAAKPMPFGMGGVSEKMAPYVGRTVERYEPKPLDAATLASLPNAKPKRRGEAA